MRPAWILVVSLLLAGCLESGGPSGTHVSSSGPAGPGAAPGGAAAAPAPDADTGSLVVTVTTSELQPVASAQVALDGADLMAFTDEAGQVTFNGLSPGKYTVLAAKPGYKSTLDKGKIAEVAAAEVTEVKLLLDPQSVIEAGNVYHKSLVFNGLIACSLAGAPGSGIGYTSYPCRGVNVAGTEFRDPNENSTHPWEVDSIYVQSIVIEAKWTPSNGLNGKELHMGVFRTFRCTGSGTQAGVCLPESDVLKVEGGSPLYMARHETDQQNLTKRLGATADKYPSKVFTAVRSACSGTTSCPQFGFQFQQRYEAWASSFYGAEAPPGWTVYPPN